MRKMEQWVKEIESQFKDDQTFIKHVIKIGEIEVAYVIYINGLCDDNKIGKLLIEPIKEFKDFETLFPNVKTVSIEEGINALLKGECLIVNEFEILDIDVKNGLTRGLSIPDSEKSERGPKVAFVENILLNIVLLRKCLRSTLLNIKYVELKGENNNTLAIVYLKNAVNESDLALLEERLQKIIPINAFDSNKIKELIKCNPYSVFHTIGSTERPDFLANQLLEGRIGLIVDGSPYALYAPFTFADNFKIADDYYINFYYASFNKVIRILCFVLSVILPGFYISLVMFHQELIPTKLALSIASARNGIPFSSIIEVFIMLLAFDIIRETGSRIPQSLGNALSIVSGLILGQAIVEAKIASTIVIIIVSLTQLSGLINPLLKNATICFRVLFLLLSFFMGFQGFLLALSILILYLLKVETLGHPYLTHFFDFSFSKMKESYIRSPFRRRKK